ncbi:MAG: polyprenyl synthetase family protein [Clostridia bacterium]|nr:MAG: polyprenyl synthetase family protein [Clostridia bacterium]
MTFEAFSQEWLPLIESTMYELLANEPPALQGLYGMMRYHLGWEDRAGQRENAPKGKRIRPLLVLLSAKAAGGDPNLALPAAAAVELLHNFSLLHDDIEDRSFTRRHRPTVWSWAGDSHAINSGDAMFVISHLAMLRLQKVGLPPARTLKALQVFDEACLRLTEGQYLDIHFETRDDITLADYMLMIAGKTAALLSASTVLGALVAGSEELNAYRTFGFELGISFQIEDDILGIWGEEAQTGKSTTGDILTRKKTLPVLYALGRCGSAGDKLRAFYEQKSPLTDDDVPEVLTLLDSLNARIYAEQLELSHADAALAALEKMNGDAESIKLLASLVNRLIHRHR